MKIFLFFLLLALVYGQSSVPEPTAESSVAEANPNGMVSYYLSYSQNTTQEALQAKCHNLNCTRIIYGIVKAIVVDYDPTAVSTLSEDPLLDAAHQNVQTELDTESSVSGVSTEVTIRSIATAMAPQPLVSQVGAPSAQPPTRHSMRSGLSTVMGKRT